MVIAGLGGGDSRCVLQQWLLYFRVLFILRNYLDKMVNTVIKLKRVSSEHTVHK